MAPSGLHGGNEIADLLPATFCYIPFRFQQVLDERLFAAGNTYGSWTSGSSRLIFCEFQRQT